MRADGMEIFCATCVVVRQPLLRSSTFARMCANRRMGGAPEQRAIKLAARQRPRMVRSASAMRRGSSVRSIATIFAPVMVNPMRVIGLPSAAVTTPAAPLISAGSGDLGDSGEGERAPGHRRRAADRLGAVGAHHDVRVEGLQQRAEVAVAGGAEEGAGDGPLPPQIGAGDQGHALDPAAAAAGQLAGRGGRAPDDGRDVIERDGEHVVQDEGEPPGRRQRVQDHQQRGTDGAGQQRSGPGIDAVPVTDG